MKALPYGFTLLLLSITTSPVHAVYKCEVNGKKVYQEHPCSQGEQSSLSFAKRTNTASDRGEYDMYQHIITGDKFKVPKGEALTGEALIMWQQGALRKYNVQKTTNSVGQSTVTVDDGKDIIYDTEHTYQPKRKRQGSPFGKRPGE